jgi:hypothetical protein
VVRSLVFDALRQSFAVSTSGSAGRQGSGRAGARRGCRGRVGPVDAEAVAGDVVVGHERVLDVERVEVEATLELVGRERERRRVFNREAPPGRRRVARARRAGRAGERLKWLVDRGLVAGQESPCQGAHGRAAARARGARLDGDTRRARVEAVPEIVQEACGAAGVRAQ